MSEAIIHLAKLCRKELASRSARPLSLRPVKGKTTQRMDRTGREQINQPVAAPKVIGGKPLHGQVKTVP